LFLGACNATEVYGLPSGTWLLFLASDLVSSLDLVPFAAILVAGAHAAALQGEAGVLSCSKRVNTVQNTLLELGWNGLSAGLRGCFRLLTF